MDSFERLVMRRIRQKERAQQSVALEAEPEDLRRTLGGAENRWSLFGSQPVGFRCTNFPV